MARPTFVQKARKDIPQAGVKKGESYYWWSFFRGGKFYSKTPPKPSQLTNSEFLSQFYAIQERIAELEANEDLGGVIEELASDLNTMADECRDKHGNLPDGLQEGPTGQLLEARADACESAAGDLENIDCDLPSDEDLLMDASFDDERGEDESEEAFEERKAEALAEAKQEFWDNVLEEVQGVSLDAE